jgi:hypothetical protein
MAAVAIAMRMPLTITSKSSAPDAAEFDGGAGAKFVAILYARP